MSRRRQVGYFFVVLVVIAAGLYLWLHRRYSAGPTADAYKIGVILTPIAGKGVKGETIKFSIPKEAQEWAVQNYKNEPKKMYAIFQQLESLEYMIRFPQAKEHNSKLSWAAVDCMAQNFGPGYLSKVYPDILSKMVVTKERLKSFDLAQQVFSGSLEKAPTYANQEGPCKFSELSFQSP